MQPDDFGQMSAEIKAALADDLGSTFGIIGHTAITYDLIALFRSIGMENRLLGVYFENAENHAEQTLFRPIRQLSVDKPNAVIVASDEDKESLLELSEPWLLPGTRVILAGHGHFAFRDPTFEKVAQSALVPSLANGYSRPSGPKPDSLPVSAEFEGPIL